MKAFCVLVLASALLRNETTDEPVEDAAEPAEEAAHNIDDAVEATEPGAATTATPRAGDNALDVNGELPYEHLEAFGREDTAQELTDASIRESDLMVDQLEKAETAEEKRAVFRALTRLRGAAITSFDGIAHAHTNNIDEYAHTHKWRAEHPLAHLADEESNVEQWAFPDNADLQMKEPATGRVTLGALLQENY